MDALTQRVCVSEHEERFLPGPSAGLNPQRRKRKKNSDLLLLDILTETAEAVIDLGQVTSPSWETHTLSEAWFRDSNQANVHVFRLWEDTGGNPRSHWRTSRIQSCNGSIIFKLASCSSNFKTWSFKDSLYLRIPVPFVRGSLKGSSFTFIQKDIFCVTIISGL